MALSSAEAELYALVKGSTEVIGIRDMAAELGIVLTCEAFTDSSAARGVVMRAGKGRLKHVHLNYLWIQEMAAKNVVKYNKIVRDINDADLLTHHWGVAEGQRHLSRMCMRTPS